MTRMHARTRFLTRGIQTAVILIFLICLDPGRAPAQILPFHVLSARDGLVSNSITSFAQDGRGRLWIGTGAGVSVFDGISFRSYTVEDGMPSGFINGMTRDPRDSEAMWIATARGLMHIGKRGMQVFQDSGAAQTWTSDVAVSAHGTVWVAAAGGLRAVRKGVMRPVRLPRQVGTIIRLAATPDGLLWMLSDRGVFRYDADEGRCIVIDSVRGEYWGANFITSDSRGDIYVCTRDKHIVQFREGAFFRRHHFALTQPYALTTDNHGAIWVACDSGLYHFPYGRIETSTPIRYQQANGLPVTSLNSIYFDGEHNLWCGTEGRGVVRLEDWHVVMFPDMTVTGLGALDKRGHLWLSAEDGLWEFWEAGPMNWQRHLHTPARGWPGGFPFRCAVGPDNGLYAAFISGAIARFEIAGPPGQRSQLRVSDVFRGRDSIPPPDSFTMCVDRKGRLWCSIKQGLVAVVEGRTPFHLLRLYRGLPHDVRTMYEDAHGKIWIAGYNTGMYVIDGNDLSRPVRTIKELEGISVRGMLMDRKGRMWIGTIPRGLAVLEGRSVRRFSKADGLLDNSIYSFAQGPDGTIWMGTLVGMTYAPEGKTSFRWTQELSDSPVWDCGVREDGLLWLATRFGLTLFDVPTSSRDTVPPAIFITGLQVNGRPVPLQSEVDLGSTDRSCRVEFATVRLRRPRDIRYQYMLSGIDTAWSAPSRERSISLAGLRPGTYTLLLRAVNSEQIASIAPARLRLVVRPPFWQSWWFILLTVAAIGGILVFVIRSRVRRLLEIERIRARIAADLHDDIGSGLTRIALMTEVMQRQLFGLRDSGNSGVAADLREAMDRVGAISRELVDGMSDVVWSIDPRNDSLSRLIDRITVFSNDLCESRDMDVRIDVSESLRGLHTSSDLSRCVLLVAKEAVNNAVRHSGAGEFVIEMHAERDILRLTIRDNGRGFDEEKLSRINGLVNMRNRVAKAGGRLSIASAPGAGTTITAEIPMQE
jgi:signal transduction histidine kinase/ligand-binding sensor domain-containing protein